SSADAEAGRGPKPQISRLGLSFLPPRRGPVCSVVSFPSPESDRALACVLPSSRMCAARDGAARNRREKLMSSGTADKVKGRVKEATGALTDDDELRDEGKLDQAVGKVKDKAGKVVDKVRDAVKKH